jgi:DNA-directed RNA polymerase subunit RPC12/RpoP
MKCPKCGSTKIKRSHSRGFQERLRKLFHQRAYRCINCGWRGILKAKPSSTKRYAKKKILVQIIIIIIIIIAIYLTILYLDREEPTPVQDSAGIYKETLAYKELSKTLII